MEQDIRCPNCHSPMILRETYKFRNHDGSPRKFYSCSMWRITGCSGTWNADERGVPIGFPANAETKEWRRLARERFEEFYRQWGYSRQESYKLLDIMMRGPNMPEFISIGNFSTAQCKLLIEKIDTYKSAEVNGG